MDTLRIDISYRPLRVGWAVRRGDFDSLRRIVRWSHTLWGGRHNPIVVVDDADHAKRIMENFRIDFIWPVGDDATVRDYPDRFPYLISPFYDKTLTASGMHEHHAQLLDIHNTLITMSADGAIKDIRDKGFKIYLWDSEDALTDIFLIQSGTYPGVDEIGIDYGAIVHEALQPQNIVLSPIGPLPVDLLEYPTVSLLPRYNMRRHYSVPAGWDFPGFYVGDAANFDDLATYWNLRAADIPMCFVDPNHLGRFAELIPAWEKRAQEFVTQMPDHPRGLAVWTRRDDHQPILDLFGGRVNTFCRVRDDSWHQGAVSAPMMYIGEAQLLASVGGSRADKPRVSFPLAEKPFCGDRWFHSQHLVASVSFGIGLYNDDKFTLRPPYVPELNEYLSRTMHFDYRMLRIEPERLGIVTAASDVDAAISAAPAADLLERIFDLAGFTTSLSNGGLIARQLITRLDGLQGARVFKIPGVRRLIRTHGPNASFTKKSALQLIGGKDPENPGARFPDHERLFIEPRPYNTKLSPVDVFAYLVEKGLFRIGADLTCPACRLQGADNPLLQSIESGPAWLCGDEFDATRQLVGEHWSYRRVSWD